MTIFIIVVCCAVLLVWVARLVASSERAHNDLFSSSGVELSSDQVKIGQNNDPIHNVILDRGCKIQENLNGKFVVRPTAKFASEYWTN